MNQMHFVRDYVDDHGINVIKAWLDEQPLKLKARVNDRLSKLEQLPVTDWRDIAEVLKNKDGLISVHAKFNNVQHRLIGFHGPQRNQITILANCTERDDKYTPRNIFDLAFDRRGQVLIDPHKWSVPHDFR